MIIEKGIFKKEIALCGQIHRLFRILPVSPFEK